MSNDEYDPDLATKGEECHHGPIARDHRCSEHEPCEACGVGLWCDDHDGIRCEQWFAALNFAKSRP